MAFSWFVRNRTAKVAAQWWADLAKEHIEDSIWGKPTEKKRALNCVLVFRVVLQTRIRQELAHSLRFSIHVSYRPDAFLRETLDHAGLPHEILAASPYSTMIIDNRVVRAQRNPDQPMVTLIA